MATSSVVRNAVRNLLQSSDAYRELPPDKRREIARNTVRVGSYMADPHGVLSKHLRARSKRAGARPSRAPLAVMPRKSSRPHGPAAAHVTVLRDPRVRDASTAAALLLGAIDFPDFVADLIGGVFNAIVDASIQQMQAYAELIKQLADTVDRFEQDSIGEAQARDWLAQRFPSELELDPRRRLRWRVDPQSGLQCLASALLLPGSAADQRELVAAARQRMAVERQQLLATMVMMGVNRVVVTDGKISARLRNAKG